MWGFVMTRYWEQATLTLALKNGSPSVPILNKNNFRVNFEKGMVIKHELRGGKKAFFGLWRVEDVVKAEGTMRGR